MDLDSLSFLLSKSSGAENNILVHVVGQLLKLSFNPKVCLRSRIRVPKNRVEKTGLTTARCASIATHKAALCGSVLADTNLVEQGKLPGCFGSQLEVQLWDRTSWGSS